MTQQELLIKSALDAWNIYISRTDKLLQSLSEEELQQATAPGRNSGAYLLGHLTAVHDSLFPLFGLGEKLYPELEETYLNKPDQPGTGKGMTDELKKAWSEVNQKLAGHFARFGVDEWLQKHAAVSAADFAKEPHRNRLNVLLNRTNHLSYHLGQLAYLKQS